MSIFDVVEQYKHPRGLEIAQTMLSKDQGFEDIGSAVTGTDSFLAFTRIKPHGWIVGTVLPKHEMFAKVESLHHQTAILAALGIALLVALAILIARSISRPLRKMAVEAVRVGQGDLNIDLTSIRSTDEVGQLARAFTAMTEGLKDRDRIKDTFGRYLTQEVVKRLLESKEGLKLGGETRRISMMMSDLRGFTALTSSMKPEDVITFLNRYLGKMLEIILDHHGIIDEIIGDGILAFFGAPETLENHPELAVACALKMQIAMQEINARNEADGLPHLEMGIAVNTGEVIVGNIGSEKRAKYGAVGSQVNFTGRLESFTVGGQVLISQATYELVAQKLDISDALDVEMKGVPGKVKLYDVRGISGAHEARLPDRDETMVPLTEKVTLLVYGMDQKILRDTGKTAVMTHASLMSAKVIFDDEITKWEDVRMLCMVGESTETNAEIYGKVLSVTALDSGAEALIRFTSVSAPAYEMLRALLALTLPS
jgi:class 3 adenylate cyclase